MHPPQTYTGVQIEMSFFPLSFFLYLCTPTVVIDGYPCRRPWGTHYFELPPGQHNIRIFFNYMLMPECGANSINVMVVQGRVSRVVYEMPPWMFSAGAMRELQPYTPQPR